ncbi:MAG: FecR family protein [Allomuricauda sp.]
MKKLFQKLINNTISKEEYEQLMELLKNNQHSEEIEQMMDESWFDLNDSEDEPDEPNSHSEKVYSKILDHIQTEEKAKRTSKRNVIQLVYKMAAVFVVAASLLFIYKETSSIAPNKPIIPSDAITVTLDNGNIEIIQENGELQIVSSKGNVIGSQIGSKLVYGVSNETTGHTEEPVYNTLTVPYGKRFDVALSDGSQVMLNAGSSIKYPVKFIKGKERKVYLKGEAYFDIETDKSHPFIVNANDVDVEVLGTEFNVSFYPEDPHINTVLVEGSVKLNSSENEPILLSPGQLGQWDKNNKSMTVQKVETDLYTAWKDGILLFRKTPFSSIRKKLERYFDVSIENNNVFLEEQTYTASFTYESLHDILETFQEDVSFEYEVLDEKILIKPLTQQ